MSQTVGPAGESAEDERGRARAVGHGLTAPVRVIGRRLTRGNRTEAPYEADTPRRTTVVDCGLYVHGRRQGGTLSYHGALEAAYESDGGFVWIGLHAPTEQRLSRIAGEFGLHPLAVEDAVYAHQRPKLERYGTTLFLVLKTARYVEHDELTASSDVVDTGEVMVFLGPRFVITVRHGDACQLSGVRARLEEKPRLLAHGPSVVLHAVADKVVDDYLAVAEAIEEDVDEVEAAVFASARSDDAQRIYLLKRELMQFKRAVIPLARPLEALVAGQDELVAEPVRTYLRDVADHRSQAAELIESFDELLNNVLQANLAQVSVQQNDDMRKISAWAAIAVIPTTVGAVYGMNFDHMPELHWTFGYPLVILLIFVACFTLHRAFRRSGWL